MDDKKLFKLEKRFFQVLTKFEILQKKKKRADDLFTIIDYFDFKFFVENMFLYVICLPSLLTFLWYQEFGVTKLVLNASFIIGIFAVAFLVMAYITKEFKLYCIKKNLITEISKEDLKKIQKEYIEEYRRPHDIKLIIELDVTNYYYIRLKTLMGEDKFNAFIARLNPHHTNLMKKLQRREKLSQNCDLYEKHKKVFIKAEESNMKIEDAPDDFWLVIELRS